MTNSETSPMLAVTIDIVPDGDESRRRPVAAMRIERVSKDHSICEYAADAVEENGELVAISARFSSCVVEHRNPGGSIWAIVANACRAIEAAEEDGP